MNRFDINCPQTGEVCPHRDNLVQSYVGDHDSRGTVRHEVDPLDIAKLNIKLAEHGIWAARTECEDLEECTPRIHMDESATRKLGVSAFRTIRDRITRRAT